MLDLERSFALVRIFDSDTRRDCSAQKNNSARRFLSLRGIKRKSVRAKNTGSRRPPCLREPANASKRGFSSESFKVREPIIIIIIVIPRLRLATQDGDLVASRTLVDTATLSPRALSFHLSFSFARSSTRFCIACRLIAPRAR